MILNFLFGRTRNKIFRVLYTLRDSSFVVATTMIATSEYEANREFDRLFPSDHIRIPDTTKEIT